MRRTSDDETCLAGNGYMQLVVAVCCFPIDQLVVVRLRGVVHGSGHIMDVDLEALSLLAGVPFVEYGVCVGHGSRMVCIPRAYSLDTVGGYSPHHGRLFLRRPLTTHSLSVLFLSFLFLSVSFLSVSFLSVHNYPSLMFNFFYFSHLKVLNS